LFAALGADVVQGKNLWTDEAAKNGASAEPPRPGPKAAPQPVANR
jgi:hypothetical protein